MSKRILHNGGRGRKMRRKLFCERISAVRITALPFKHESKESERSDGTIYYSKVFKTGKGKKANTITSRWNKSLVPRFTLSPTPGHIPWFALQHPRKHTLSVEYIKPEKYLERRRIWIYISGLGKSNKLEDRHLSSCFNKEQKFWHNPTSSVWQTQNFQLDGSGDSLSQWWGVSSFSWLSSSRKRLYLCGSGLFKLRNRLCPI